MVIAMFDDAELRQRAWDVAATVVDPEIPVLSIADLGVLREVSAVDGRVEVAITPTYSGCPAMNMITLEIETALAKAGIAPVTVTTTRRSRGRSSKSHSTICCHVPAPRRPPQTG